jgi:hypothetical protein
MQRLFAKFLILSVVLAGCASTPAPTKFDGKWEFFQVTPFEEPRACLEQEDVKKLRELLIRCESKGK